MMARLAVLAGAKPVVWDTNPERRTGNVGYDVIDPKDDSTRYNQAIEIIPIDR
jgi:3-hydroxyethyl bacteriochlorophyllide a dehydrogenase